MGQKTKETKENKQHKQHCLIVGGTGFVGTALVVELLRMDWSVTVLSRRAEPPISGCARVPSLADVETPVDAIVNLTGAPLAARRWTSGYKREIVNSRLDSIERISQWMSQQISPPEVFVQASAIGYYGHQAGELDEHCGPGEGFSSELCQAIEARVSSVPAAAVIRLGVVLDRAGGALPQMAQTFRFGIASYLGDGHQVMSWIHRHDAVRAIVFLITNQLNGVFNVTAPNPVSHRQFARTLERHFKTYLRMGMPKSIARALIGEMAEELLLNGQSVLPQRLLSEGFSFTYPQLEAALAAAYPSTG
jgi:uncharacterized protein (TIGR01777 family)